MIDPDLSCKREDRREAVRAADLFGLDYIEVSDNQLTLTVFFLGKAPQKIDKRNVKISGGRRIVDIRVTAIHVTRQKDPALDDSMDVFVAQAGDFSTYTLSVVDLDERGRPTGEPMQGFDPRFSEVGFTFKGSCPTGLDCKTKQVCPPPVRPSPEIDYLAKDYESFRQSILDRMALTVPAWQETHVPDIGIALVELLAYVGDYLSYYQDAVATEAYLFTARQRISVRRHARLVDYAMHEGCNSRAWEALWTDTYQPFDATKLFFITAFPGAPGNRTLTPTDLESVPPSSYMAFQPLLPASGTFAIYPAHSEMHLYAWGDSQCCKAAGATSATLIDAWAEVTSTTPPMRPNEPPGATDGPAGTARVLHLCVGDVLIFEERLGPKTGNPADADPTHRQAVRLTKVLRAVDALGNQPVVEIWWASEDALTFPLCISSRNPASDCTPMDNVSVALGNVMLVDNGGNANETIGTVPTRDSSANCPTPCHPATVQITAGKFCPALTQRPLTFSQPISPSSCSAAEVTVQDLRLAMPCVALASIPPAPDCAPQSGPPVPCTIPPLFTFDDLRDPTAIAKQLKSPVNVNLQYLYSLLSPGTQQLLAGYDGTSALPDPLRIALIADFTALLQSWYPVRDLLESGPNDFSFVAEMDDDSYAHLRFGDGQLGRQPDAGMEFQASYRIGNGESGNVGAETITYLVYPEKLSGVTIKPHNPLPATGGADPEPVADVKYFAPSAFRNVLERAITGDDYAAIASDNARRLEERPAPPGGGCEPPFVKLQGAKGVLRWTGSWYEALVAVDPVGTETAGAILLQEIDAYLEPYRRMGQDLTIDGAQYVPLDLALSVCVLPDYLRGQVEAALLEVFGNGVLPDGSRGFFHPDNLTFGEGIYVSQIVAAAQAVTGVASVSVKRLRRYRVSARPASAGSMGPAVPTSGVLTLGPFEIAQLDNDPSFPENGRLQLSLRGGR